MAEEGNDFAAAPRVVNPKKKYKQKEQEEQEEDEIKLIYNNLMWDKRVFRGNTYSALVTSKNVQIPHANTTLKPVKIMQHPQMEQIEESSNRRANIQIFTDEYVETLTDKPPRYEYGAQTQFKLEKPVIRHQMPIKIGLDRQTQIWDDQFFDFDYQVEPLLSVLVARTLELSRMEVLQEQEHTIMRNRQRQLHLEEEMQRKKIQQMYQKQEQLQLQNAKRLENYKKQKQKKEKTHRKLFARVVSKQYLRDLRNNTLGLAQGQGFFRNPIDSELIQKVLPSFYKQSLGQQASLDLWRNQAQQLLNQVKISLIKQNNWAVEVQRTRRKKIVEKREEKARQKNERKLMGIQQKYMLNFLHEEKLKLQKEEEQRRLAEEGGQNGDGQ